MSTSSSRLDHENHFILDEPLLRLPYELHRKVFKKAQNAWEREKDATTKTIEDLVKKAGSGEHSAEDSVKALDAAIAKMQNYKRKVEVLHLEEKQLHGHQAKRIAHLQDLYKCPDLMDKSYERWSRKRLDRLLVDYFARQGYLETAKKLAEDKGILDLVDLDMFMACARIEESLKNKSTAECLVWCAENKLALRKHKSDLEFELRLQDFVDLMRNQKLVEAMNYAKKFLAPHKATHFNAIRQAAGLLAASSRSNLMEHPQYKALYSQDRWLYLAETFVKTHNSLLGLPPGPSIFVALPAGLSALKVSACYPSCPPTTSGPGTSDSSLCPICSTELKPLAKDLPFAHYARSSMDLDPVVLPNNRIYSEERLHALAKKLGLPPGMIRDPTTGEDFEQTQVKKVFIM
ncbi:CTLH/CRA C-terminal to lish motif domain-containing protein [Pyronema omphalodes]|nr:CTLH/CRA C-terminal to lish motif domain-containing protein [Pyronema omphalodes]